MQRHDAQECCMQARREVRDQEHGMPHGMLCLLLQRLGECAVRRRLMLIHPGMGMLMLGCAQG